MMAVKKSFDIQVRNQTRSASPSQTLVKKKCEAILEALGWDEAALSIILLTDAQIRTLNKKFLGHDRPTDVIAFGQIEDDMPVPLIEGKPFLGDIAVSLQTARRESGHYGNAYEYEVFFYLAHGILHLMGFDDATASERERMHRIQSDLLAEAGITNKKPAKKRRKR